MGLSCSFIELEAKFIASSLLLNSRHFDKRKYSWQRCKENSQNSETPALTKKPVGRLLVERYKKRHLAAQVRSANGLRCMFKFSEILGRPSCILNQRTILRPLSRLSTFRKYFISAKVHTVIPNEVLPIMAALLWSYCDLLILGFYVVPYKPQFGEKKCLQNFGGKN